MSLAAATRRVTVGDVLANREFRAMYVAQALSVVGDQLARIAAALLVYSRWHSALPTAVRFAPRRPSALVRAAGCAVSSLRGVVGAPLLAGYPDRLPRRSVMIACDL